MMRLAQRFLQDQGGATAIEYAVVAGFLSIVILGAVQLLGLNVKGKYTAVQNLFN